MRTAERILGGLTLMALGFVFLVSTLGFVPWSTWTTAVSLLSLWPVLLVTAGLDIIGRGLNAPWMRVLSSVIALVTVLYGGLVLPAEQSRPSPFILSGLGVGSSQAFAFSEPKGGTEEASCMVQGGAGEIIVTAGERRVLAKMTGESPFDNPALEVERSGRSADVVASLGSGSASWPLSGKSVMRVALSPAVMWDTTIETGASSIKADLRDVPTSALSVKNGVSSSEITLGDVPFGIDEVPVRLESGIAAVTLHIPSDAEIRVEAETGLSSVSVPSDLEKLSGEGRTYESPGFDSAGSRYIVRVQTGIGSVHIERYEEDVQ